MCGIAGLVRAAGRSVDPSVLRAMSRAQEHRGPDQSALIVHGPLGLASNRLAIVDLGEGGAQPIGDGKVALSFNGEIYNRHELAGALRRERLDVSDRSDTAVLFEALRHWGLDGTVPRLVGMFAFAWADLEHRKVWLVRDRLGIKPLVWTDHAGDVAWASEAKALAPVRPLTPDPVQALFALAGRLERSPDHTAFVGVRQVPPGHVLEIGGGAPRLAPWARPEDLVDEQLYRELERADRPSLDGRLERALTEATRRVSLSDAPLGLFLSGGTDSSLLAAVRAPGELATFTADVGGTRSEADAAARVARDLGLPLTRVEVPHDVLLSDWAVATWHAEAPIVTHVNGLAFRRLALAARGEGVKAVLTGEGADELFHGYPEVAAAPIADLLRIPGSAARRGARLLPGPLAAAVARRANSQADFLVDAAGAFEPQRVQERAAAAFAFLPERDAARQATSLTWLGPHLLTLLRRNDALGMAASVEARFPYLDDEVIRFGVNLPARSKVTLAPRLGDARHPFLSDKAVLRRVAHRRVGRTVARRDKVGFAVYGHDRVRTTTAFWQDGYVVDLLGLPHSALNHLVEEREPYLVAKLASVEVFGLLYARGRSIDGVGEHVRSTVSIT